MSTKDSQLTRPQTFPSKHLILDVWGARHLDDTVYIENALIAMIEGAGATLIKMSFHNFSPNGGVTGIALLAESHISIHTWPEYEFAAFDIFMCGNADVEKALPILEKYFTPKKVTKKLLLRGELNQSEAAV